MKDLEKRLINQSDDESGFCRNMRKAVELDCIEDIVNQEFNKISSLKEKADRREEELEVARKKAEHDKKIHKVITEKVEFKKSRAFKR